MQPQGRGPAAHSGAAGHSAGRRPAGGQRLAVARRGEAGQPRPALPGQPHAGNQAAIQFNAGPRLRYAAVDL